MGESPRNPNPSLDLNQKTTENQNHKSAETETSQASFEGWRFGISRNQVDQPTRLSQVHLLVRPTFHFDNFHFFSDLLDKMALSTKLEDKLEGIENLWAWKYRIGIILEENVLSKYIKEDVSKPEEDETKEKH